jgi:hypothetical protein
MPCMETTELKGDLGIDPCPKLSCVTDTGFEVIDDPWARFCAGVKPTRSNGRARMRSRISTHQIRPIQIVESQDMLKEAPMSACCERARQRMRGLFARMGNMKITTYVNYGIWTILPEHVR